MINLNYQKRKNTELFKSLESSDTLFLSKIQNYIPIYKRFFSLNETNYNSINLNHKWYISSIKENIDENPNLFLCNIKNNETQKIKETEIFFKLAPLLDPYKYLIGKYNISDLYNIKLPDINSNEINNSKIFDVNNSAYVDGFFIFLTSKLLHNHKFIHGVDYYGSFVAIKNDFKQNVFDDLEYLTNSDFFNKNKDLLFKVDNFSHLFNNEVEKKLKPIKIEYNTSAKSNISIKSIKDDIFENIFENTDITTNTNNDYINLSEVKEELIDLTNSTLLDNKDNKTTTIKSNSTCSSRTSYTNSEKDENNDNNEYEENDCKDCETGSEDTLFDEKIDKYSKNNEDDDLWEDIDEESNEIEEEKINATFEKFPVHVICMENCEYTFDELILNNNLKPEEWYSALMQVIMILITYQKMFSFTHNDLHTNNIMYNNTNKKYIYYKFKNIVYKVPTFGRLFKIIDFGRAIYKFNGNTFCSDSFQNGGDASTQYNTEPYFNVNKPRLEPNFSFDLCRLACSIFDYVIEDLDEVKNVEKCEPIKRIINEWCLDDKGINLLYKNNGEERYPDFKLYKMIARGVHNHTPQMQLERPEFKQFSKFKGDIPDDIIDIDKLPCYV